MTSVNQKKKKSAPIKPVAENSHETSASESHAEIHESAETHSAEASSEAEPQVFDEAQPHVSAEAESQTVHIEFPYSDLVRAKIPKAFAVAEKVATDWKNEGDFHDLGLPHPIADVVAAQALKKAKEVEKKLEEKGVFTLAKMGMAIAKAQVEQVSDKLSEKLNEKMKKKDS